MNIPRESLGVWDWDKRSFNHARNSRHEKARTAYVHDLLGDATPRYIWKIEFFREVHLPRVTPERYDYGMTLHCYAGNAEGKRYMVFVKAYDERGNQVNTKLAATLPPENFRIEGQGKLPPEWLLLNNPEPKDD